MQRDVRAVVDGAVGGGVGTITMSAVMLAAEQAGLMGDQPPELITDAALDVVGAKGAHPDARRAMSLAAHFGFGIASGGLFGALHRRLADVVNVHPVLTGVVFGTLVWAVSYMGWVPALSIMPSPDRDRPSRPWAMVIAHWVYGATLGAVLQRLLRRELRARRSVP